MTAEPPDLPENIIAVSGRERTWNGVRVEAFEFQCSGRVLHQMRNGDETRLSVVLEEVGGMVEPRLRADRPNPIAYQPRHMHFAPAGLELWGYTDDVRLVRDANLCFDLAALSQRMAMDFPAAVVGAPRMRFTDDRLWTLVRLLVEVVDKDDPSTQLYGDGLTLAIAARLLALKPEITEAEGKGLGSRRLRHVIGYLEAHLPERVELTELAAVAGLSPAHFSRAFKASTGVAPYRWQLNARVRQAQTFLVGTNASLDEVAEATGFADAVHFGRTFRKIVGASPAAWRRERKS